MKPLFIVIATLCMLSFRPVAVAADDPAKKEHRTPSVRLDRALAVHPSNPSYFADAKGRAIWLGGHQIFNDIQDNAWVGQKDQPVALNWSEHLRFMQQRNLNYLRNWITFSTGGGPANIATPMPYARTGPGLALDGQPKFDLERFDEAYFTRLHERIRMAQQRGIVVSIMLFEVYGFNANNHPHGWAGNMFNAKNNINGIEADTNGDGIGLEFFYSPDPKLVRLQRGYVKKVIDTLNDLDKVFFEVANECGATSWQHALIDFIHEYESRHKPRRHLVLMSPGGNDVRGTWVSQPKIDITHSHADVIAVLNAWDDYRSNPPVNDEGGPAIMDMDHIAPKESDDPLLPWKAFTRGYHYSLYDHPFAAPRAAAASWELARKNIGAVVTYSRKFSDLARAEPRPDLSSTRFCLAHPGHEYVILQPKSGEAFSVHLQAGTYRCEWFRLENVKTENADNLQVESGPHPFVPLFEGPAVLHVSAVKRP